MEDRTGCWYCGREEGENHFPWCEEMIENESEDDATGGWNPWLQRARRIRSLEYGGGGKTEDGSRGGENTI